MRNLLQKIDSLIYDLRARIFKRSETWRNHPHNVAHPRCDRIRLHDGVRKGCQSLGVEIKEFPLQRIQYEAFKNAFRLPPLSLYALRCRDKKLIEHYVAFKLLDLKPGDRYVDIASENSPFPDILSKRAGINAYSQDLTYPPGVHGNRIGSSADQLPVTDNWIKAASLQCAYEHFESNIDSNFIRELGRVLAPGGRCVIVPLYMAEEPINIYDPLLFPDWTDANADAGAKIIAEIALGGRFERLYAPSTLHRIFLPGIGLRYTLFCVTGHAEVLIKPDPVTLDQISRIQYALLVEKIAIH